MNNKILPFICLAVLATMSVFSCRKPDPVTELRDENALFIPLEKGKYITYNVDSTLWFDTACVTLVRKYQMMYTVADTFTDAQGRQSYRIDTRIRQKTDEPWKLHDVLYITRTDVNLEWSQSGLRQVKMIFPIRERATWKGNSYVPVNDADLKFYDGWDFHYTNVGESFNTGEVIYPSTLIVNQVDRVENDPERIPEAHGSRTYGKKLTAAAPMARKYLLKVSVWYIKNISGGPTTRLLFSITIPTSPTGAVKVQA
jgi:hypothetical protein